MLAAEGALRIPFHFDFPELRFAGIEIKQPVSQWLAYTQHELERLRGLNGPDDTREYPDDASLLTGSHESRRRWSLEDATIAGGFPGKNRCDAAVEAQNAAMDQRLVGKKAGIVDQKLGREIVHPVNDHIVIRK